MDVGRDAIVTEFRRCEGSDLHKSLLPTVRIGLSVSGALSLTKLLRDSYDLEFKDLVSNLLDAYGKALDLILGPFESLAREIIGLLSLDLAIPDHWKYLFGFLAFYLSGLRYSPRKYCFAASIFRAWAGFIAILFSLLSALIVNDISSATAVFIATAILISGLYFYYLPLHYWRATFDRPVELAFYQNDETWRSYFNRQQKDLLNIFYNYAFSLIVTLFVGTFFELEYSVALLLVFFAAIVAVRSFVRGFLQTLEWRRQKENLGRSFRSILFGSANAKTGAHYALAILSMLGFVAFGTYGG